MKTKQLVAFISLIFFVLAVSGCTTQAWYESVKQGAENNCRKQPPSESERCQESLNMKTYEEYDKDSTRTDH